MAKLFRSLLICSILALIVPSLAVAAQPIALVDVMVLDPASLQVQTHVTVLIEGEVIAKVGAQGEVEIPADALRVDARGKFLIPGLADMHAHLDGFGDTAPLLMIAHGVTLVRDMGGDFDLVLALRERINAGDLPGPQILTAGPIFEARQWLLAVQGMAQQSPHISPLRFRVPFSSAAEAAELIELVKPLGPDFIKIRNSPSPEAFAGLIAAAHRSGLTVSGHEPMRPPLAQSAAAGLRSVEHVPFLSFDPPSGAGFDEAVLELAGALREHGTFLDPTLIAMRGRLLTLEALQAEIEAEDPRKRFLPQRVWQSWNEQVEMRKGENSNIDWKARLGRGWEQLRILHREGVPMVVGTDLAVNRIYPGSSVHEEMALLVEKVGMTPFEALQAATANAAALAGLEKSVGRIQEGFRADLVLLDADPLESTKNLSEIDSVIVRGRLFDGEQLAELRELAATRKDDPLANPLPTLWQGKASRGDQDAAERLAALRFVAGDYRAAYSLYKDLKPADAEQTRRRDLGLLHAALGASYTEDAQNGWDILTAEARRQLKPLVDPERRLEVLSRVIASAEHRGVDAVTWLAQVAEIDSEQLPASSLGPYHQAMVNLALHHGDHAAALRHYQSTLAEGWEENPQGLNSLAWWCFEHGVALDTARAWAEKAIELDPNPASLANTMDTLAEIVNAQGDPAAAADIMQRALALHATDYSHKQLKRFSELAKRSDLTAPTGSGQPVPGANK